jgi:predicted transcriptional regulator
VTLAIGVIEFEVDGYLSGNSLWHNALVTLNIDFQDPTGSVTTVGEYFIINVYSESLW